MEIQIKRAVKAGNSSAVILPRSWLDKEVRVELVKKTQEIILFDVLKIIKKYIEIDGIIGIYLAGSYARGEEDENSDIDILVITKERDREIIIEENYNILVISEELLKQKLQLDLFPIGSMIKEARPLLNAYYLNNLEVKITKKNVDWYIKTTEEKLKLIEKILIRFKSKKLSDRIAYTLVLRLRTLYIIEKLMKNKDYHKKDFLEIIRKASGGENAYQSYIRVKNNEKDKQTTNINEIRGLYLSLKDRLEKIKKELKEY